MKNWRMIVNKLLMGIIVFGSFSVLAGKTLQVELQENLGWLKMKGAHAQALYERMDIKTQEEYEYGDGNGSYSTRSSFNHDNVCFKQHEADKLEEKYSCNLNY